MKPLCTAAFLAVLTSSSGFAIGPHEVVLLINERSADSVEIGEAFAELRGIPERNIIRLPLWADPPVAVTPSSFRTRVMTPAAAEIRRRAPASPILAWVYSCGFPVRIHTDPPMSIQGFTFLRGVVPGGETIQRGRYVSPLYAGPHGPGYRSYRSQTLGRYREWLGAEMPLPSMMLAYTGERGDTVEESLACLRRGRVSDGSQPAGRIFFHVSDDLRSKCRTWQYRQVWSALPKLRADVSVHIVNEWPRPMTDVLGVMMGEAVVSWDDSRKLLPGAMAEHLTSLAGVFDSGGQTKMSHWIRAGATATAGTVTEPYSVWAKFPSARFFVHYAAGCTVLESFYQSIRCPLQILLLGDPLAAPYADPVRLTLEGWPEPPFSGRVRLTALVQGRTALFFRDFLFLLDGKAVSREAEYELDTDRLAPGRHTLRCVARSAGLVRQQVFVEKTFIAEE